MASILKHLRSSTADKRPTASGLADGQIAINTASGSPGLFVKDSNGGVVKVGPAHVGTTAPNVAPAGSAGNSLGELWVNNATTTPGLNYYTGSAFVNLTPSGTTTTVGLVELATGAETQTGTDAIRAVTPSGLQSKLSDSISTTSSTTIASSTAVKAAYDLADAALPKSGGRVTGNLEIGPAGSLSFEGSSDDSFETTVGVVNPTADRTINFPDVNGTVITTGDTGTVTSTMILDGTIVNADVNASAAIAGTKVSPDFGSQNVTTTGTATAASFNPTSATVPTDGLYKPGTNQVALATNGVERVEFGTSEVVFNDGGANYDFRIEGDTNSSLFFVDASAEAVGIGTTAPDVRLHVATGNATGYIKIDGGTSTSATTGLLFRSDSNGYSAEISQYQSNLSLYTAGSERARIDSSGRLLVGTSSARTTLATTAKLQVEGVGGSYDEHSVSLVSNSTSLAASARINFGRTRGTALGSFTAVQNGDFLGVISFGGANGTDLSNEGASIHAAVDAEPFTSGDTTDLPTRLVFSTTADGASSPTERMRINNQGSVSFIKTVASSFGSVGVTIYGAGSGTGGSVDITRDSGQPLAVNRLTNDGTLIEFYQDTVLEGNIAVSGTTVSYNGAHLSRWSQLPGGAKRTEILRGTVLSNIDEMCRWGEEANEQLNRMKVSDVEGDSNVAGVFQAWDDDNDTYIDDFYCAMTGDFIIRIADGVTVQRGDLLMSAGDGTAKPQDDDIIRSKTVAKVTSTHVTCTYDDGSYCVPCVLMAC